MTQHCPFCCPLSQRTIISFDEATMMKLIAPLPSSPLGTRLARYSLQDAVLTAYPQPHVAEAEQ